MEKSSGTGQAETRHNGYPVLSPGHTCQNKWLVRFAHYCGISKQAFEK
jgi:hypothetical protein